jgi:hypothetical protein
VLRGVGRHYDRIGTAAAGLGEDALCCVTRAEYLATRRNVAAFQPRDGTRNTLMVFPQFSLIWHKPGMGEAESRAPNAGDRKNMRSAPGNCGKGAKLPEKLDRTDTNSAAEMNSLQ